MMLLKKRLVILFLLLLILLNTGYAMLPAHRQKIRSNLPYFMGMGGVKVVWADENIATFYLNPAGLVYVFTERKLTPVQEKQLNIPSRFFGILEYNVSFDISTTILNEEQFRNFVKLMNYTVDTSTLSDMEESIDYDEFASSTAGDILGYIPFLGSQMLDTMKIFDETISSTECTNRFPDYTDEEILALWDAYKKSFGRKNVVSLNNHISLSYMGRYAGFASFVNVNSLFGTTISDSMLGILPSPTVKVTSDFVFDFGLGIPLSGRGRLSMGINLKQFYRFALQIKSEEDFIEYGKIKDSIDSDTEGMDALFSDTWSFLSYMFYGKPFTYQQNEIYHAGRGTGFDIGFMYTPTSRFRFALLLTDVYTQITWFDSNDTTDIIPPDMNVGLAFFPRFEIPGLLTDIMLAAEYDGVMDSEDLAIPLKLHFGARARTLAKYLTLKVGFNQGYPTFGLMLDLSPYPLHKYALSKIPIFNYLTAIFFYWHIKIEYNFWGEEGGTSPGSLPVWKHSFSFSFTFQS